MGMSILGFGYAVDLNDTDIEMIDNWEDVLLDIVESSDKYSEIEFNTWNSDDFPMPLISLKSSFYEGQLGDVTRVAFKQISDEEKQMIKDLADQLNLRESNEEPYWFLVSYTDY